MDQENRYIVIVDDDEDDRSFLKEAFLENGFPNRFVLFENGVKLMEYLLNDMKSPPLLIIIDLQMPLKNGKETLQEIKENARLHTIPVIILSTALTIEAKEDILQLGANCIVTKPNTYKEILELTRAIAMLWQFV